MGPVGDMPGLTPLFMPKQLSLGSRSLLFHQLILPNYVIELQEMLTFLALTLGGS